MVNAGPLSLVILRSLSGVRDTLRDMLVEQGLVIT
jgi:hypothetical protein